MADVGVGVEVGVHNCPMDIELISPIKTPRNTKE